MPCRTDDWDDAESQDIGNIIEPALCAILKKLEKDQGMLTEGFLNGIDWKEAGVTKKEFLSWWEDHKEQDRIRVDQERKEAERKRLIKEALAKLTKAEKRALGIE